MFGDSYLQKSIIIGAHPDDEVLWFSSILDKVDEVVICFLGCETPHWSAGRKQILSEYPIKNVSCIGIDESEVFDGANWQNPVISKFGIEISSKAVSDKNYIENYYKLRNHLKNKLVDCQNVFTHNPWGEYGNEEHIQIYRVVKELQKQIKFNLWFTNYCSNKSANLMLKYLSVFCPEYITKETNKNLSYDMMKLYKKNGCWTWYDDWECFNKESFIKDNTLYGTGKKYGHIFPLNMINVKITSEPKKKIHIFNLFVSKILKKLIKR